MKRLSKVLAGLTLSFIVIAFLLLTASTVFAIEDPDTIEINGVYVYRNCIEDEDQLYIIDFTIDYTTNPDEHISEAYDCYLMDDDVRLGSSTPISYFNDGYARGVTSIYFSAGEAPVWEGAYTVRIEGDSDLDWDDGTAPYDTISSFEVWQDFSIPITQELVSERIIWLADRLDENWSTTYTLVTAYTVGIFLSTNGVEYFSRVIANLNVIAPYALADRTIMPELYDPEYTQDYADSLEDDIAESPLDLTDLGSEFGMSRGQITAILYYGAVLFFAVILVQRMETHKPIMLLLVPLVILGAFIGVPLTITIVVAFLALLMIGFSLFYSPSNT